MTDHPSNTGRKAPSKTVLRSITLALIIAASFGLYAALQAGLELFAAACFAVIAAGMGITLLGG
ncbi:MAG: hypothetical protein Kow00124_02170 [Anaerolineae bacterium]